jgi:hypothetical protein
VDRIDCAGLVEGIVELLRKSRGIALALAGVVDLDLIAGGDRGLEVSEPTGR